MAKATPYRLLFLVWMAFVTRGLFYCVQQPMWEGYDEWAHFAYIQHIAEHGRLPVRGDTVSKEIRSSLSLMPSPYGLRDFNLPLITHEDYWRLAPEERLARKRALASLPAGFRTQTDDALSLYEAQQPPLYYLIMAVPYEVFRTASLPTRIVVLRVSDRSRASRRLETRGTEFHVCRRMYRALKLSKPASYIELRLRTGGFCTYLNFLSDARRHPLERVL